MSVVYCHWLRADGRLGYWGDEPAMRRVVYSVRVSREAASAVVERVKRMGGGGWVQVR